ncbi:MAG TPA: nuclear transport factor 2 family protein [Blastocatellia bacterium]|nr:nuclear transport factor 2 family protein [Blastocatellia bacterium]
MSGELSASVEAEQKVRQINKDWVEALQRGDTATLNRLMAEDCIFSYALDGDDKAQFISDIDAGALRVESIKRDNVEVRIYGQTGVLLAYDTTAWQYKGHHMEGYYRIIHVYSEQNGRWQIVAIQASPISAD